MSQVLMLKRFPVTYNEAPSLNFAVLIYKKKRKLISTAYKYIVSCIKLSSEFKVLVFVLLYRFRRPSACERFRYKLFAFFR